MGKGVFDVVLGLGDRRFLVIDDGVGKAGGGTEKRRPLRGESRVERIGNIGAVVIVGPRTLINTGFGVVAELFAGRQIEAVAESVRVGGDKFIRYIVRIEAAVRVVRVRVPRWRVIRHPHRLTGRKTSAR